LRDEVTAARAKLRLAQSVLHDFVAERRGWPVDGGTQAEHAAASSGVGTVGTA